MTVDAEATIARWRRDPVAFVRENFGVEPDDWQAEALRQTVQPGAQKISLQACAGPGKSAVLAWIGWHFLATMGDSSDHPKGVAVSVSGDNLSSNLWPEFHKWRLRSDFLESQFDASAERLWQREHKDTWFLAARTWPRTASPDEQGRTLSGLHGRYVLALIDESGSIPPAVSRAAEQALSTGPRYGVIVQAGNPLSREGMLYAASRSPSWHVIRITGDPDDPRRSKRIDINWARQAIAEASLGRSDPWVQAYILGQFPASAINTLLTVDDVERAMERAYTMGDIERATTVLGVDVAGDGLDQSVIFPRRGLVAFSPLALRGVTPTQGAAQVARQWDEYRAVGVCIDNTGGWGSGWVDQLRNLGRTPHPIEFAGEPTDRRFANKRAEMWWQMAEWVRTEGALPRCRELVAELTTPTYTTQGDRLLIEPKKDIKKRLGRSPDYADALALTFAVPFRSVDPLDAAVADARKRNREGGNPFAPIRPKARR